MNGATTTREQAREGILAALLQWRAEGVEDPTIPVYADVDGDGIPDVYGLDAFGRLELRPDLPVAATVAPATGAGVEGPPGGSEG